MDPSLTWPREYYQRVVETSPRFRFIEHTPGDRAIRRVLPRYLRPRMRVLDIGCGVGVGAAHLAASGARGVTYLGIDPDHEACGTAREVLAGLPPDQVTGEILERPAQEYLATAEGNADLILWSFAFHECVDLSRPGSLVALTERVARMLHARGTLLIGDPFFAAGASAEEIDRTYAHVAEITGHCDHGKFVPDGLITRLFTGAGLTLLESHDLPLVFLARYKNLPHARYALLVFGKRGAEEASEGPPRPPPMS